MIEKVQQQTPSGRTVRGSLAKPGKSHAPGLIIIHEWWGFLPEMEEIAEKFAHEGFLTLAVDMYDGKTADTHEGARKLQNAVDKPQALELAATWVKWLRDHPDGNGKVGVLGYCFGGAWSLNFSIAVPVDATVIYYGYVNKTADELKSLAGPVLGHFGQHDKVPHATPEAAQAFEVELRKAGKPAAIHIYDADHAFCRVGFPTYDEKSANLSWQRSIEFLKRSLASSGKD